MSGFISHRMAGAVYMIAVTVLVIGCTRNYKPDVQPLTSYPVSPQIDMRVQLKADSDFANYIRVNESGPYTFRLHYGDVLSKSSEALAKSAFRSVSLQGEQSPEVPNEFDAQLTPRLVLHNYMIDGSSGAFHMFLQWTLVSPDGKIIWKQTVRGAGAAGTNAKNAETAAVRDVFSKSYEEIVSSPEITRWAGLREKKPAPTD